MLVEVIRDIPYQDEEFKDMKKGDLLECYIIEYENHVYEENDKRALGYEFYLVACSTKNNYAVNTDTDSACFRVYKHPDLGDYSKGGYTWLSGEDVKLLKPTSNRQAKGMLTKTP